jgi:hypothetical protein
MATKGHWPKGKSRNLPPAKVGHGRKLADLLRRAIDAGHVHPTLGRLSLRVVAADLDCDHTAVWKWCRGARLPPERALERLRAILHNFKPED